MNSETKQLVNSTYELRKVLSNVLQQDVVDYIIKLIVLDSAHQKFIDLTSD